MKALRRGLAASGAAVAVPSVTAIPAVEQSRPAELNEVSKRSLQQVIVLFGPPGSGKGTQARLLMQKLDIPHISTGDMLRQYIESGNVIGHQVQPQMKSGQLVPDELVNEMVRQRISQPDCQNGFILDGYPRTIPQAVDMESMLAERDWGRVVIFLKVDYNKVVARLNGRRQCPLCGTLYSIPAQPPRISGLCDKDGTPLVVREDDRADVIQRRLVAYEEQTRPVLEFFARSGKDFYEVDSSDDPPTAIVERISGLISAR